MEPWLQTRSGIQFTPKNPQPDQIDIDDIAHSLSMQVRYCGHLEMFYSVAQHSVLCSLIVAKEHALCALLHDATEAYMGDLPSPIKRLLPGFQELEEKIWREAVAPAFGLPEVMPPEVKTVDMEILRLEKDQLVTDYGHDWGIDGYRLPDELGTIFPLLPNLARSLFINRFNEIKKWDLRG